MSGVATTSWTEGTAGRPQGVCVQVKQSDALGKIGRVMLPLPRRRRPCRHLVCRAAGGAVSHSLEVPTYPRPTRLHRCCRPHAPPPPSTPRHRPVLSPRPPQAAHWPVPPVDDSGHGWGRIYRGTRSVRAHPQHRDNRSDPTRNAGRPRGGTGRCLRPHRRDPRYRPPPQPEAVAPEGCPIETLVGVLDFRRVHGCGRSDRLRGRLPGAAAFAARTTDADLGRGGDCQPSG